MPIVVQKFGGTSVADADRIRRAASRAIAQQDAGNQVVVVVSAMGQSTDDLIALSRQITRSPSRREMDMLLATGEQVSISLFAMAVQDRGRRGVSMTGWQAGMITDAEHSCARLRSIDARRLHGLLADGNIVVVAGFQGVANDQITTLGRGGSDTTAVALAAALQAPVCEIYTDVEGIFTTDPRIVPQARKLDRISYDEMLEMASLGAGVMHGRSIELGKKYGVQIHVRSSFSDNPGTIIMNATPDMEGMAVRGATLKRDITRVTLEGLPNRPGVVAQIFDAVARRGVFVDDIILGGTGTHPAGGAHGIPLAGDAATASVGGKPSDQTRAAARAVSPPPATLSFTVAGAEALEVAAIVQELVRPLELKSYDIDTALARVSVVGVGMRSHRGVAATMFNALAAANINIQNITTSEIVISVLVHAADAERALSVVHQAFQLDR